MRFLLKPVRTKLGKDVRAGIQATEHLASAKMGSNRILNTDKAWGQQCSQTCGCVVRFETTVDPESKKIVESKYYAKSVVSIQKQGKLEPVYTNRKRQPMFRECECKTVHDLAQKMSQYLPNKKIDRIRSLTEFSKSRSSPAFRHAVLAEHGLPRTDTHCYDVIEEAFTAMIKGVVPKHREQNLNFRSQLVADIVGQSPLESHNKASQPVSMSSASVLAALEVVRAGGEPGEDENSQSEEASSKQPVSVANDWISYVDEQYHRDYSA